jgi:CubicO group peptidase (beta-lactamase class C family)
MTRFVPALVTLLGLTSCTLQTNQAQMKGPQAVGVSPDAPKDPMKIWRPAGMEADANWVLDKAGIERGGCCISATLRDYARFGLFIAKGDLGPAGAVLPAGWIDNARKPVWPATDNGSGYGWGWWVRQDGGYEAVGAYGQSVTIYPKDDVVIAVNAASRDPHGFGIARWRLLQALDAAAVGRPDPNDKTK